MADKSNKANWRDHWDNHARQWSIIGSPLRPCQQDIANIKAGVIGSEGLILGATPELSNLTSSTISVDHNSKMISKLATGKGKLIFGEWLDLPFEENSFDYVAGDGSLTMLNFANEYEQLCKQLNKVLKPHSRIILRLFASPAESEDVATVINAATSGEIGSFHAFKWRFAMAMVAENKNKNINVAILYDNFNSLIPDRERFAKQTRWTMEDIGTIDVYKKSSIVYSFPTLDEVVGLMEKDYKKVSVTYGGYELAERCPVITFEKI